MLKIEKFAEICGISPAEKPKILNLENLVNLSIERHLHKWLEKMDRVLHDDVWTLDCPTCYNNTDLKKSNLYQYLEMCLAYEDLKNIPTNYPEINGELKIKMRQNYIKLLNMYLD